MITYICSNEGVIQLLLTDNDLLTSSTLALFFELNIRTSRLDVRNSPYTTVFNTQVITTHLDLEEAELTPVGTVVVSTDPVLDTVLVAPTNNRDFLVRLDFSDMFREDTTLVCFELLSHLHTAGNGSVLVDGLLHVLDTVDNTVVRSLPVSVLSDVEALVLILGPSSPGSRHITVLTKVSTTTGCTDGDLGLVVLAGVFGNTVVEGELIDSQRIASLAVTTSLTVEDDLQSKSDVREGVVSGDHDSVSKGSSSGFSPAGGTVTGTVDGSSPGEIVDVTNVSPVVSLGKVLGLDALEGGLSTLGAELIESAVKVQTVSLVVGSELDMCRSASSVVSSGLVGVVSDVVSPGVFGNNPVAASFDTDGVVSSSDTEETVLTPERAPGVSDQPVFSTVFIGSEADDRDDVIEVPCLSGDVDKTGLVVFDPGGINHTGNRASVIDLVEHLVFTIDVPMFFGFVDGVALRNITVTLLVTDTALESVIAGSTILPTLGLVVGA